MFLILESIFRCPYSFQKGVLQSPPLHNAFSASNYHFAKGQNHFSFQN